MIFLREITRKDIPVINQWRNDKEVIEFLASPFRYINYETDEKWFNNYLENRQTQVRCAICLNDNTEVVGVIYLTNIDSISRSAEYSIMIGEKRYQGMGIGTLATNLIINYAFDHLNLNRIYLTVLEQHKNAIKLYEKVGFKIEGLMRESVYKNGCFNNQVIMALIRSDVRSD